MFTYYKSVHYILGIRYKVFDERVLSLVCPSFSFFYTLIYCKCNIDIVWNKDDDDDDDGDGGGDLTHAGL